MNVEQLEKLAKLKEQGLISDEEYEANKKKLLKSSGKSGLSAVLYTILGVVLFVAFGFLVSVYEEYTAKDMYGCNDDTMGVAKDLINQQFPNLNNSVKLKNPELVSTEEGYLLCRASTNYPELAVVHYTVQKQEDGELLIRTNPKEDVELNEVLGIVNALSNQQKETEQQNTSVLTQLLSYQLEHNKQVAKMKDILSSDLSESENMIAPNCSILTPLLVHSLDSKALLTNRYLHQGTLGYQFAVGNQSVSYSFYEKFDFETGETTGYDVTVTIEDTQSANTLKNEEAIATIFNDMCVPLNEQLNKLKGQPISTIVNTLSH